MMDGFGSDPTHYEVLELTPDASPADVRAAYVRMKSAYRKDSQALYSLLSAEQTQEFLARIEEAYQILSTPERRREYDRSHGFIATHSLGESTPPPSRSLRAPLSFEIDPNSGTLVAPPTDFGSPGPSAPNPGALGSTRPAAALPTAPLAPPIATPATSTTPGTAASLAELRALRGVSREDLAHLTKINRAYIAALEEENFEKLPAPVYVRGFLTQLIKALRAPGPQPGEPWMSTLLARYQDYLKQRETERAAKLLGRSGK